MDLAKEHLDIALDLKFGDYKTHYYFGMIMKEKSDYKQAEIHFLIFIEEIHNL